MLQRIIDFFMGNHSTGGDTTDQQPHREFEGICTNDQKRLDRWCKDQEGPVFVTSREMIPGKLQYFAWKLNGQNESDLA